MRKLGWQAQLVASFALVLSGWLLFQLLYVVPYVRDQAIETKEAHQEEIVRSIARELDVDLTSFESEITRLVQLPEFRNMDIASQRSTMAAQVALEGLGTSIAVMDAEGWFVSGTMEPFSVYTTRSYADSAFFSVPFEQGETYWATPRFYSEPEEIVGVSISVPIWKSDAGERVGVLIAGMRLNELVQKVADYPLEERTEILVMDGEGTVVAHSGIDLFALEAGPLSLDLGGDLLVQAIMAGGVGGSLEHDHDGTSCFGTYAVLESNGWAVVVHTPVDAILASTHALSMRLTTLNVGLFVVALAASLAVGWQIAAGRKRAEDRLRQRLRYEQALARCSETLLAGASGDEAVHEALNHLLAASRVSRAYVFENFEDPSDGLCSRQLFEVCAPGISP